MDSKDLLSKLSSRGDVGAAALGFSIGFAIDVLWFPDGVPSATTASVLAVGTVGLKNSIQAFLEARKTIRGERVDKEQLAQVAESLETFAQEAGYSEWKAEISLSRELWKKNVLEDSDFKETLDNVKRQLREAHLRKYQLESRATLKAAEDA